MMHRRSVRSASAGRLLSAGARRLGTIVILGLIGVIGCGGGSPSTPSTSPTPTPSPTPAPSARYAVTFDSTWSAATHPDPGFPPVAHFSGLIGATHDPDTRFWEMGALASEGIRLMAEEGSKTPLDAEIEAAIAAGRAETLLSGGAITVSPGSVSLEFDVTTANAYVTLVAMIAPSPDWFVGVSALPLMEGGDWAAERMVPLGPYDAGTDSGKDYLSRNRATEPREPIAHLEGQPFQVGDSVPPLGAFTFRRLE